MKKNRLQKLTGAFMAMGFLTTVTTLAIDIGDPVYKKDVGATVRLEVLYEKYDRDMKLKANKLTLSDPEGQFTIEGGGEISSSVDENLFILRLNLPAIDKATVYLDVGIVDEDKAESTPFIVGGGAHMIAYEKDKMRLNVVAMAHYVPSFDIEEKDFFNPYFGWVQSTGEMNYYEVGAGMILSGNLALDANMRFVPYGGILFSLLRGTADTKLEDSTGTVKMSDDIEEDSPISGVAGLSLLFQKSFSIRVEGRFIGDSSLSAAIGVAF